MNGSNLKGQHHPRIFGKHSSSNNPDSSETFQTVLLLPPYVYTPSYPPLTSPSNHILLLLLLLSLSLSPTMPTPEENTPPRPPYVITVSAPEPDQLLLPLIAAVMVMHDSAENPHQPDKDSPLPASKKSIEAMPMVKVTESETESLGSESCAICLGEYEIGGEAKEMPCKHRFHSGCIDKWLGIHGSCPVCRYEMPAEEDGGWDAKLMEEENRGRRGEGFGLAFSIETVPWGFGLSSDDDYGRSDDEGGSDGDEAAHDMEIDYDSMID